MQSTLTFTGRAEQAIRFIHSGLLLGVGRKQGVTPDPAETGLTDLIGYFPLRRVGLVRPEVQGTIQLASGERYQPVKSRIARDLASSNAFTVLAVADITHSSLPPGAEYDAVGLFTGCLVLGAIEGYELIPAERVTYAVLDQLVYLPLLYEQTPETTHTIELVREF